MPTKIFLSYAHENKEIVLDLYQSLKESGFDPWLDDQELLPGMNWKHAIRHALEESEFCIVCLSSLSVKKRGYVQKELKYAKDLLDEFPEGGIFVIPVRLDDCEVPDYLRDHQYVDLFAPDGKHRLLDGIRRVLEEKRAQSNNSPDRIPEGVEGLKQDPIFHFNSQDWMQFERQVEYYRQGFSYKLFELTAEVADRLKHLTASPTTMFYKTSQWQELNLAIRNLLNYSPQSHEKHLKPWVLENIARLIEAAAERYVQLQDWNASKMLYELVLLLGVDPPGISAKLESIRENIRKIESLKEKRYELVVDAIRRGENDESIQSILEWFMEIDPDYRDLRQMWLKHIRR